MKRKVMAVMLMIVFCLAASLAFAEAKKIVTPGQVISQDVSSALTKEEESASQARWSLAKKVLGLGAGCFAGFVGHELGHQLVATVEDVDMSWYRNGDGRLRWWAHTDDKVKLRNIALGGFAEQILSSEIILGYDKIPKDNSFVIGYMCFNILNSIIYTLENETSLLSDKRPNDLQTLDECGIKKEYVEIVIVSHALLSAWRLYKKPEFLPFIKASHQELIIGLSWPW